VAGELAADREVAGGQGVGEQPVSGDFATTANLALVVSGVPTSGEKTKASGASGASGSTPGSPSAVSSHVPSPTPPRCSRSTRSGSGRVRAEPSPTSTTRARPKYPPGTGQPPASADRRATRSPSARGSSGRGRPGRRSRPPGRAGRAPPRPPRQRRQGGRPHLAVPPLTTGREHARSAARAPRAPGASRRARSSSGVLTPTTERSCGSALASAVSASSSGSSSRRTSAPSSRNAGRARSLREQLAGAGGQRGAVARGERLAVTRRRPAGRRRRPAQRGRRRGRTRGAAAADRSSRRTRARPVLQHGRPVAIPSSGPARLRAVLDDLDGGGSAGSVWPGAPDHHDRPVDPPGDEADHPAQQRRAVPLEVGLGRAHARGAAPGQHHCGGPGHGTSLRRGCLRATRGAAHDQIAQQLLGGAVTASTAVSNAARLCGAGARMPEVLRTYCRAAARTSSGVTAST
jgi:hypothetical protein